MNDDNFSPVFATTERRLVVAQINTPELSIQIGQRWRGTFVLPPCKLQRHFLAAMLFVGCALLATANSAQTTPPTCNPVPPPHSATDGNPDDDLISPCLTAGTPTSPNLVTLSSGAYNLTVGLVVPGYTTLISATGNRESVILNRATSSSSMGPIVTLTGTNVALAHITLNGQKHPPFSMLNENVNVFVQNCQYCTVEGIDSSNSRLTSIWIADSNSNIRVIDCYVHDNGDPVDDSTGLPYRSDGLSVERVDGVSYITGNSFTNNTDIDLIFGGGMSYLSGGASNRMSVISNTIAPHNLTRVPCPNPQTTTPTPCSGGNPLTGAGLMFDTQNGWSKGCDNDGSCGDFSGFLVQSNTVQCGTECGYGIAIGSHMNNNWGNGPTAITLFATHLLIDPPPQPSTNVTDRMTVDYTGAGSIVNPAIGKANPNIAGLTGCWYSSSSVQGSYNNGVCKPCTGYAIQYGSNPASHSSPSDPAYRTYLNWVTAKKPDTNGSMCDEYYDSGYRP